MAKGKHINQEPGRTQKKSELSLRAEGTVTAAAKGVLTVML